MSPRRIYLDKNCELFCLVDEIDYEWAMQWRWAAIPNQSGTKFYASRSTRLHGRAGPQTRIYLHKAILERMELIIPSALHTIGDHKDGNSLNDVRSNLVWATVSENNRNRFGRRAREPEIFKPDASVTYDAPPF